MSLFPVNLWYLLVKVGSLKWFLWILNIDLTEIYFLSSCHPAEGPCYSSPGGRDGSEVSMPMAGHFQHGVLDQTAQKGSDRHLSPGARDELLSPLPGEGRVPEEHAHGRKHFPEERHTPGHRALPLLRANLPSRFLEEELSGGRFR